MKLLHHTIGQFSKKESRWLTTLFCHRVQSKCQKFQNKMRVTFARFFAMALLLFVGGRLFTMLVVNYPASTELNNSETNTSNRDDTEFYSREQQYNATRTPRNVFESNLLLLLSQDNSVGSYFWYLEQMKQGKVGFVPMRFETDKKRTLIQFGFADPSMTVGKFTNI